AEIGTIEREHADGLAVVARPAVGFADVDALPAERLPYRRQDARAVGRRDAKLHGAIDLGLRIPGDFDPPLGIGVERLGAPSAVDRDASSPCDEPDDLIARQ